MEYIINSIEDYNKIEKLDIGDKLIFKNNIEFINKFAELFQFTVIGGKGGNGGDSGTACCNVFMAHRSKGGEGACGVQCIGNIMLKSQELINIEIGKNGNCGKKGEIYMISTDFMPEDVDVDNGSNGTAGDNSVLKINNIISIISAGGSYGTGGTGGKITAGRNGKVYNGSNGADGSYTVDDSLSHSSNILGKSINTLKDGVIIPEQHKYDYGVVIMKIIKPYSFFISHKNKIYSANDKLQLIADELDNINIETVTNNEYYDIKISTETINTLKKL